ncbi:MAG TPA: sigma-54 dependent transcriptional regulator [Bacteroidota bacterium]|nr:sigma-54 dependent transcriptional regulator [Bacteroidota bacterium]
MTATGDNGFRILVVDDEERIRHILALLLRDAGYIVETAADGISALSLAREFAPRLLIVDLQMPRMDGLETIARIRDELPDTVGIILTAHGSIPSAVEAIKQGVYDYITKPFDNDQILLVVRRAVEVSRLTDEVDGLRKELHGHYGLQNILGESGPIRRLRDQIAQVAATDATVLIEGESGTGKELTARAIHFTSRRKVKPFVVVDCTAIPTMLIESEFFGHEKGSFTGAYERKSGKFEDADGGTVFLDEIGELPLDAQTKLLRVLQEREFNRIGSAMPTRVDVRIIAATNKNLEEQTRAGKFREDLFYRLNVLKIEIPPLRKHSADISLYVDHFLTKYRPSIGRNVGSFSRDAIALFEKCEWRGNIRELENTVQRALLCAKGNIIGADELAPILQARTNVPPLPDVTAGLEAYIRGISELSEREAIQLALREADWNRTEAARRLKVSRKTLFNKMRLYGLGPDHGNSHTETP